MRILLSMLFVVVPLVAFCQEIPEQITFKAFEDMSAAERLVQQQLTAYNNRDIEAFLAPFSDSVRIYNFPERLSMEGKDNMRIGYSRFFDSNRSLHCTIVNRIVQGNTVIDQEYVSGLSNGLTLKAIAIYKIRDNAIAEVYFIREE